MPIIGWIITALTTVFRTRIGAFIAAALAWAGLSYGFQKVLIGPAVETLESYLTGMGGASDLGAVAFNWIGVLQFDVACTMLISAYTTKLGVGAARAVLKKA